MLSSNSSELATIESQIHVRAAEIDSTIFHELDAERNGPLVELHSERDADRLLSELESTPQRSQKAPAQTGASVQEELNAELQVAIISDGLSGTRDLSTCSQGIDNSNDDSAGHSQREPVGATENPMSGYLAIAGTTATSPQFRIKPGPVVTRASSSAEKPQSLAISQEWIPNDEDLTYTACAEMIHAASNEDQMESVLLYACQHGAVRIVEQLLGVGINVHCRVKQIHSSSLGPTAVHIAVMHGQAEAVLTLLRQGALSNEPDHSGRRPLHHATGNGDFSLSALLLEHGARPDLADNDGMRPLHIACRTGSLKIARLLLDAGASSEAADGLGYRPLHLVDLGCDLRSKTHQGFTPLQLACMCGNDGVLEILLYHDTSIDLEEWSSMPLVLAVSGGHRAATRLLLESGADINRPCPTTHKTLLHMVAESMRCDRGGKNAIGPRMIESLCRHGAAVNAQDVNGNTPLHTAVSTPISSESWRDQWSMVKCLLSHGARADMPNHDGLYSLTFASRNPNLHVFRLVLAASIQGLPGKHLSRIDREIRKKKPHVRHSNSKEMSSLLSSALLAKVLEV